MGHIEEHSVLLLLVEQLASILFGLQLKAQDRIDGAVSQVSANVALCMFVLITAKMYYFRSIECLVPAEWPDPWEHAAESYCYTEGAYAVPSANLNKTGADAWEVKVPQTYYYWIPIILTVLAMILMAPQVLWDLYIQRSDQQPGEMLAAIALLVDPSKMAQMTDKEVLELNRQFGAHLLSGAGPSQTDREESQTDREESQTDREESQTDSEESQTEGEKSQVEWTRKAAVDFNSWRLFGAYMACKALRIAACLVSMVFLQRSLGLPSLFFGPALLTDTDSAYRFPTLVFCDVPLRQLAGWNVRVVQCVLPMNLLLEKVAIFFWFWLTGASLLCAGSAIVWLVRVGSRSRRRRYVKKFIKVIQQSSHRCAASKSSQATSAESLSRESTVRDEQELEKQLIIRDMSTVDRIFALRLIEERIGMMAAYVAMAAVINRYMRRRQDRAAREEKPKTDPHGIEAVDSDGKCWV